MLLKDNVLKIHLDLKCEISNILDGFSLQDGRAPAHPFGFN